LVELVGAALHDPFYPVREVAEELVGAGRSGPCKRQFHSRQTAAVAAMMVLLYRRLSAFCCLAAPHKTARAQGEHVQGYAHPDCVQDR